MSYTRQVTIWCDNCGNWEQATASVASLRKELRRKGWKCKADLDLCPSCVKGEQKREDT